MVPLRAQRLPNFKVLKRFSLNFDATDFPHSPFEWSYPKVFKVRPEIDLVSPVVRPGPSRVRKPRFVQRKIGYFEVFFF